MISGLDLPALASTISLQASQKRDFIAGTKGLLYASDGAHIQMPLKDADPMMLGMNPLFHRQVAQHVGVPSAYYDRMRTDAPELLAWNVNHWFESKPETRMIRTIDGKARAFLSKSYRPLDNADLFAHLVPMILDAGCEVKSSQVTEQRMYIQAVFPKVQGEVKVGDVIQSGIIISNSEVGMGSCVVEPMTFRLVCKNGMVHRDNGLRKSHVGARHFGDVDLANEVFRDETKLATDRAFWMQCSDVVKATLTQTSFNRMMDKYRVAAGVQVHQPMEAVEITGKVLGLLEGETKAVLDYFIKGADITQWGLANAITRTAEDATDYDRAVELEALGGRAVELPATMFAKK